MVGLNFGLATLQGVKSSKSEDQGQCFEWHHVLRNSFPKRSCHFHFPQVVNDYTDLLPTHFPLQHDE